MREPEAQSTAAAQAGLEARRALVRVARGQAQADVVLRNGRVVNVFTGEVHPADVALTQGLIAGVARPGAYGGAREVDLAGQFLAPGLVEAHTHIESTLLTPGEFTRALAPHGTTTCVSDPHEIANVSGMAGLRWMLHAAEGVPLRLLFTLPSCVPASEFESNGATLRPEDLLALAGHARIASVGEVMNFPGVLAGDATMLGMIALGEPGRFAPRGLPVDGHAPGLRGLDLCGYVAAGAQSDHETVAADEALEKLRLGMWLWVREGSMRNLEALLPVVLAHQPARAGFVADDLMTADLLHEGDLDHIIRLAIAGGLDPVRAVAMASLHPAQYFGFGDRGAIAPGYRADLVVVPDLREFRPSQVYVGGELVAEQGVARFASPPLPDAAAQAVHDTVRLQGFSAERLRLPGFTGPARAIGMVPDQIVTEARSVEVRAEGGALLTDPERDVLKVAVVERYGRGRVCVGLLHGLGLRAGAMASSVAHDAHNIVVAGTDDVDMALAVREIEHMQGGLVYARGGTVVARLALPLAGLMSPLP
ncbi:MAG TPA: adenine deaminase C-terminal domain-containing protein, partial [Steroidobacteraceae bacterium]|nr:adenine deaminase C-terminal domain-containing protein [Steroidobacteraceae bacterium]